MSQINSKATELTWGTVKATSPLALVYANYRPFKLKGSPATIGGTNYSFFEVPVKGHSYFVDASMYVPIRESSIDFSYAGLGTAKLITGCAGVDGTNSVDKFYTNSAVKFTRYGASLDFYLSPTLALSTGLMQSKYDDFGITIDTAGTANVTAKNMNINEVNVGLKNIFKFDVYIKHSVEIYGRSYCFHHAGACDRVNALACQLP